MRRILSPICLLATLAFASVARADTIDNPNYKSWAGQKVGTVVTLNMVTEAGANKSDVMMAYTLVALTAEGATVELVMTVKTAGMEIKTPARKIENTKVVELPPGRGKDYFEKPDGLVEQGTETVTVDGVAYKTKWMTTKANAAGVEAEGKLWEADDVPNMTVKLESKVKIMGMLSTTTMTLVSVKKP